MAGALSACGGCGGDGLSAFTDPVSAFDVTDSRMASLNQPFDGDFDAMRERRAIRAFVTYNHTQYFLDGAEQKGVSYELLQLFQKHLNKKYKTGNLPIEIVIIPVTREKLLERLAEGYADLALGALTVTDERRSIVDFSDPLAKDIKQIVVTGPAGPSTLAGLEDLAGEEVWVRPASAQLDSLRALSDSLEAKGGEPIEIKTADPKLEDEDLLEMVNAGLYGTTVVDSYLADFWAGVFTEIRPRSELVLRDDVKLAWAVRKGTPELMAEVNKFVKANRKGTKTGNVLLKRYLGTTEYARNAFAEEDLGRFRELIGFFQTYADRYRFDWLMVAAQGYQESRLDQSARSRAGAIGVMQVMPKTARDPAVGIPNIEELEPNIHAGTKYLRFVADTYFNDPDIDPVNQALFAFASYNAGPTRISQLRREAGALGLDANQWFHNVELVAARRVGREPVQYVANIFKYYIAYTRIAETTQRGSGAKKPS